MLIDVHAHLDDEKITNVEDIILNSKQEGIKTIINCGLNQKSNRTTLKLSKKYSIIKPAFGFYPSYAEQSKPEEVKKEIEWIKKNKPFAISEIGLDFKEAKDINKQKEVFILFLKLAKELDIPAIIHSRKAEQDVLEIVKEINYKKIVLHCFTGKKRLIKLAEEMGLYFSIPVIIIKSSHFQDLVKNINLSRLLTETDSPYLAPIRGEINEPKNVRLTINMISKIKGITAKECEKIIYMNYQRLFL
jgi:TatD DNase family protein